MATGSSRSRTEVEGAVARPPFHANEWFRFDLLLTLVGILYILRVPILLFLVAAVITWGGLDSRGPGATFLRGIYDVAWPPTAAEHYPTLKIVLRFFLVSLSALMFAVTLAACSRNILRCSDRFGIRIVDEDQAPNKGLRLLYTMPSLALALVMILGVTFTTTVGKVPALAGDLLGAAIFGLLFVAGGRFRKPKFRVFLVPASLGVAVVYYWLGGNAAITLAVLLSLILAIQWVLTKLTEKDPAKWIWGSPVGYVENGRIRGHHLLAAHVFSLVMLVYGAIFVFKSRFTNNQDFAQYPLIPTLSILLILAILVCWTLCGITFFLDRYRIPLLFPIIVYGWFASSFPQSDHFYRRLAADPALAAQRLTPGALLDGASSRPPVILVATTGGGIRAAAWTARVLRQLQLASGQSERFLSAIRLISSVSGGSVGSMYFVNSYANSERTALASPGGDALGADPVLSHAQASSLDDIAVELAYQDTLLGLLPFIKGLDYQGPGQFKLLNGRADFADRGAALENALKRGPSDEPLFGRRIDMAKLLEWKKDAIEGRRPGVIFNATVVESGKRMLFTTTDLNASGAQETSGRLQFHELYPGSDLNVTTAVRLSATFPIVSPAARAMQKDVFERSDHVVDGGYADNYGMASLVEWLDSGLEELRKVGKALPPKILIIEIRSSPQTVASTGQNEMGFLFQTFHPVETLINLRNTGQLSHNQLERDLVTHRWADQVSICSVVFQPAPDGRVEPLNWHLTIDDIQVLKRAWDGQAKSSIYKVLQHLKGEPYTCN